MKKIFVILMVCFVVLGVVGSSGCIGGDQEANQTNDDNQESNEDSNANSDGDDNTGGNQGQSNVNI